MNFERQIEAKKRKHEIGLLKQELNIGGQGARFTYGDKHEWTFRFNSFLADDADT